MTVKTKKRIHHYLPQWYLKRFTKNNKKKSCLFCVDLKDKKVFSTTPKKVGAVRDFNRIDHPEFDPDFLENELDKAETRMQKALDSIEKGSVCNPFLDPEHKGWLLCFIALLAVRTPQKREYWSNQNARFYKTMFDLIASRPVGTKCNGQVITQELKEFVEKGNFCIETPRNKHIQREFSFVNVIFPLLHKRKWRVLKTTDEMPFITSDAPVILSWNEDTSNIVSPGFGVKHTTVLMTLSKNIAIAGCFEWNEDNISYMNATKKLVAAINANIRRYAQRFIYSPIKNFWFIEKNGSLSFDVDKIIKK